MNRTIILITDPDGITTVYSNFKKTCAVMGWKYNTLSKKKLPIQYRGYTIERKIKN